MFQHTAARRRLDGIGRHRVRNCWFQHTAARRRLDRPPAITLHSDSFNTQPPEGGWLTELYQPFAVLFQHTAARRRLELGKSGNC